MSFNPKEGTLPPGDDYDAFLDYLFDSPGRPDPLVSQSAVKAAHDDIDSTLPVSDMRMKRNKSGGGGGRRPRPPSPPPSPAKTAGGHGPGPPSPSPTAKTTRVVNPDWERRGRHGVPMGFRADVKKGEKYRGVGLFGRLARRFRLVSLSSGKHDIAEDDDRRDDEDEVEASILSSISSNESRKSARSTILPYPFVARTGSSSSSSSSSSSLSHLDRCSVREQCSMQYSATYDRSELDGNASTWAFSVVGGGELESVDGGTLLDGYIDVDDLLRNARNFNESSRFVQDERRRMERLGTRREHRLIFI